MRERKLILQDILNFEGNIKYLKKELDEYPFDSNGSLIIINSKTVSAILKKTINGIISFDDIEEWANIVECRDDVDFENENIQEIIFELANPELNEPISLELLIGFLKSLDKNFQGI